MKNTAPAEENDAWGGESVESWKSPGFSWVEFFLQAVLRSASGRVNQLSTLNSQYYFWIVTTPFSTEMTVPSIEA